MNQMSTKPINNTHGLKIFTVVILEKTKIYKVFQFCERCAKIY